MNNKPNNFPGFTAEASLYSRGGHHYAEASVPMAGLEPQTVSPSQAAGAQRMGQGGWWQCWFFDGCMICCSPWWCWWVCRGSAAQS
jgi:hypothetical protein